MKNLTLNKILRISLLAMVFVSLHSYAQESEGASMSIDAFTIQGGEAKDMSFRLDNPNLDMVALEFHMTLPDGLSLTYDEDEEDFVYSYGKEMIAKKKDYTIDITKESDSQYWIIMYPGNIDNKFTKSNGVFLTTNITADPSFNSGNIKISGIVLSNTNEQEYPQEDFELAVGPVGVQAMKADKAQDGSVYTLSGVKVLENASSLESLGKGVYITNGKKVVR